MHVRDYIYLAWRAIWERRGRTIGAIIGIVIAVVALGVALSVGEGFYDVFVRKFASVFGVNVIYVIATGTRPLTDTDIILMKALPYVEHVLPIAYTTGMTYIGGKPQVVFIVATSERELPRLIGASSLEEAVVQGRPILASGAALVGYYVAFSYTGQQYIYPGQRLTIELPDGRYLTLTVTGILAPTHVTIYGNPNIAVFVSYDTYFELVQRERRYVLAVVYVSDIRKIDYVVKLLRKLFPLYEVFNPATIVETFESFVIALEVFLGFLAGVGTLIVGLWMFDTMMISVIQRTREIGILKAIGFTNRQIFLLILAEALVVSLIGVLIGDLLLVGIVGLIQFRISPALVVPAILKPWILVVVSATPVIVNVLAALLPAYRASRITPLQALRAE